MKGKKYRISDLIEKVISPLPTGANKGFWQRETVLLKKLLVKYPDISFWQKVQLKKVPTFAVYLTLESGYLFQKYQEYLFQPTEKQPDFVLGEKAGEDYNISAKPKSVKDFLS